MKTLLSLLLLTVVAGCAGSPMGVEYRVPPTVDPELKAQQDEILRQRIQERSKGQETGF